MSPAENLPAWLLQIYYMSVKGFVNLLRRKRFKNAPKVPGLPQVYQKKPGTGWGRRVPGFWENLGCLPDVYQLQLFDSVCAGFAPFPPVFSGPAARVRGVTRPYRDENG